MQVSPWILRVEEWPAWEFCMDFIFYNYFYEVVIWIFHLVLDLVMYARIKLMF